MKAAIKEKAFALGFDDCRVTTANSPDHAAVFEKWIAEDRHGEMRYLQRNADKRIDPQKVLPGAKSIVVVAASYMKSNSETSPQEISELPAGVVARYAQFSDYHDVIGERLKLLADFFQKIGPPETHSLWYVDTGPLLERDLAQRAGLGFVGKHTNLISRKLGNWIFLGEILTTLDLEPDEAEKNRCGNCSRCIAACPTDAITAPFSLDARRCISYLTIELKGSIPLEFREQIGNRIYGCDDCLAACPWNRFAREGKLMKSHARTDLDQPNLIELLALDDAAFKRKFSGTPISRTKRRGFLRNVCVALGNVGDERALSSLEKAANDFEPLIAEHARWAMEKIREKILQLSENADAN